MYQTSNLEIKILMNLSFYVGTGKTLLARAVASQLDANFLKVISLAIDHESKCNCP